MRSFVYWNTPLNARRAYICVDLQNLRISEADLRNIIREFGAEELLHSSLFRSFVYSTQISASGNKLIKQICADLSPLWGFGGHSPPILVPNALAEIGGAGQ